MKKLIIIITMVFATISSAMAFEGDCCDQGIVIANNGICKKIVTHEDGFCLGNYELDMGHDVIYLIPRTRGYNKIRITSDYRLFVNREEVRLDDEQQALVVEFYDLTQQIEDDAERIGYEGAKIGAAGAKLGVEALASVFKLIRSDYDSDDLEREMELKASKLEDRAADLELLADKLEEKADRLEVIEERLENQIPEIRDRES